MPDLRRISTLAVVMIVAVRFCIGWQFTYEGLWKLNSQSGTEPWTAAGYLKNARGPFRDYYRNMAGDPDDLSWLDYDQVAQRWDDWHRRFQAHHPDLSDDQQQELDELLHGAPEYRAGLKRLPPGVKFGGSIAKVARFDPEIRRLIVNGAAHPKPEERHLTPAERDAMLKLAKIKTALAPDQELSDEDLMYNEFVQAYYDAVKKVYDRSSRLGIKERALALLRGDPERATQIYEIHQGTIDHQRMGNIDLYKRLLAKYEQKLAAAETAFEHDHLKKQWAEIQRMRADLVGPIKALDAELKEKAGQLLTAEQLARGPVPEPLVGIELIDRMTMWSLLVIGVLLMAGLLSRLSAIAAAGLLLSFYLAMPPWPGVPGFQELPGPEHSFIVDKNLIEVFALLAIAAMPTGQWFGVDALLARLFGFGRKSRLTAANAEVASMPPKAEESGKKAETYEVASEKGEKQPTA